MTVSLHALKKEVDRIKLKVKASADVQQVEVVDMLSWSEADLASYDSAEWNDQLDLIESKTGHRPVLAKKGVVLIEVRKQSERSDDDPGDLPVHGHKREVEGTA